MQIYGRKTATSVTDGRMKVAVVDPSIQGGTLGPNDERSQWVPIKPASDGAFVMALIRWLMENDRLPTNFLESPNLEAARKLGYNSFMNATYLVIDDPSHPSNRKFLQPADLGWSPVEGDPQTVWIVIDRSSGKPTAHHKSGAGQLYFRGEVTGQDGKPIKVRTAMTLLKESAESYTLDQYAELCGIPRAKIEELAQEFSAHGYKVASDGMGGSVTANGYYSTYALKMLPFLMGAANKKGGMLAELPSFRAVSPGPRYDLNNYPGAQKLVGINLSRDGIAYERTPEYKARKAKGQNPYPSTLPWYPLSSNSDNQMLVSIIHGYPYRPKIFVNWFANPLMAHQAAASPAMIEALKKPETVPLFISLDAFMAETTALADYIIPDATQFETWGAANLSRLYDLKSMAVRWPVVEPLTVKLADGRHANFENYLIDVAIRLGLPGFGDKAIPGADGQLYPLRSAEDFWLKAIANIAYDGSPVPNLPAEEAQVQYLDEATEPWRNSLQPEEWPKAWYVMARGGRFDNNPAYKGDNQGYAKPDHPLSVYFERAATSRNSMTGEYFPGAPGHYPERLADGRTLDELFPPSEWPFRAASHKPKFRSVTMLANAPVMQELNKTNFVQINSADAEAHGIADGDQVRIISATGPRAVGIARVRPGVARGTLSIAFGYGHWEYGARGYSVGDQQIGGDPARGTGVAFNAITLTDPTFDTHYALSDPATGVGSRNGGRFKIEKV